MQFGVGALVRLYGREQEQKKLLDIYRKRREHFHGIHSIKEEHPARRGNEQRFEKMASNLPADVVFVTGTSGTGKTALIQSFQYQVQKDEGGGSPFIIQTKFGHLGSPDPHMPFLFACADFCHQLVHRHGSNKELLKSYSDVIFEALDGELTLLTNLVPELETLFTSSSLPSSSTQTVEDGTLDPNVSKGTLAKKRSKQVLRLFFRAVASLVDFPIVLFIEDLQWAQEAALDILTYLVTDIKNEGMLFVLTTTQTDQTDLCECMAEEQLSLKDRELLNSSIEMTISDRNRDFRLSLSESEHVKVHHIPLDNLSDGAVLSMSASFLGAPESQLRILCDTIMTITNGNALLVKVTLQTLAEKNLLRLDMASDQWVCDSNLMFNSLGEGNIQTVFKRKLLDLPEEVQETLINAAFLGSQHIDKAMLQKLSLGQVASHLDFACERGLLIHNPNSWGKGETLVFAHDVIQYATYSLIAKESRESNHLQIGNKLWQQCKGDGDLDHFLPMIAYQCVLGSSLLDQEQDRAALASLCLQVGENAAKSSNFQTAQVYLMYGVYLLRRGGRRSWRDNYDLCLRLHNAAAEVCYCNTEFDMMSDLVDDVLFHARSFDDTIQARSTQIYALGSRSKMTEAIEIGLDTLRGLGEKAPSNPSWLKAITMFLRTRRKLRRLSDEDILNLPLMKDPRIENILLLMNHIVLYCLFKDPRLIMCNACRMVDLTLKNGLSAVAVVAFTYLSIFMCGAGAIDEGYRVCKLTVKIHEHFGSSVWLSRVSPGVYGMVLVWKEPIETTVEPLRKAFRVGLASGDIEYAFLNLSTLYSNSLEIAELPILNAEITDTAAQMDYLGQKTSLDLMRCLWQFIHNMMGLARGDPKVMSGNALDPVSMATEISDNPFMQLWIRCHSMVLALAFGDYDLAVEYSKYVYKIYLHAAGGMNAAYALFFECLSLLAQVQQKTVKRKHSSIRRVRRLLKRLKGWAKHCPMNFLGKQLFIEAELAVVMGNFSAVPLKYTSAILQSRKSKMLFQEALANERFGKYYILRDNMELALPLLRDAHALYAKWGGLAKMRHLEEEMMKQHSIVLADDNTLILE